MLSTYAVAGVIFAIGVLVGALITGLIKHKLSAPTGRYKLIGGCFMRRYAQDRPADTTSYRKAVVVDSEGGALDPQPELTYTFSSDKPELCDIVDNGDGTVTTNYGTFKKLEDGSYDIATLRAESNEIDLGNGEKFKDVFTEQVQLIPGTAASAVPGGFQLPE